MSRGEAFACRKLDRLALPLVASLVPAAPGDVVRLARESDGTWLHCRVAERLADGNLLCSVIEAQSWPSLLVDGIVPGMRYAVRPDRVLSVVSRPA
jgi:hypothetical protein